MEIMNQKVEEIVHPSNGHTLLFAIDKQFNHGEHCSGCCEVLLSFKDHYYCPKGKSSAGKPNSGFSTTAIMMSSSSAENHLLRPEKSCGALHVEIKDAFVLHHIQCPFNLDLRCAYLKPSAKHDHHKHLLAYFKKLYLDDESTSEEIVSSPKKIGDNPKMAGEDIMKATSNEIISAEHTILLHLDKEVMSFPEKVKSLKKKLKELEEREQNAESVLRELEDKFNRK
ncbi:hypothetical protein FEM48_Zijuj03G0040200 [Ziziphus jujuba var. spinosa]|uniref:Uncharacterized protein n=1 Tax=Ziziphus jujuba var. spinosa TaxID=714518 RepID=A0A978VN22_ZIZJJ|nr:hypothetical protein FEM48_Zijuj03G0040200 [Ziziphus jujuba var. spinosa]